MHWRGHLITGRKAASLVRLVLLSCALVVIAPGAWALGLGDLEVRSYLGQPLQARVELISRSPGELEGISARLASADSFRLVGLDRMALSVPVTFTVIPDYPDAYVEVRSKDPVDDPVLQFVVEVNFANGRLLRQYTVFLDPPTVAAPVPLPAITTRPKSKEAAREPELPAEPVAESVVEPGAEAIPPVVRDGESSDRRPGTEEASVAAEQSVQDAADEQSMEAPEPVEYPDFSGEDELAAVEGDSDVAEPVAEQAEPADSANEEANDEPLTDEESAASDSETAVVEEALTDEPVLADESEPQLAKEVPAAAETVGDEADQDVVPMQAPVTEERPAYLVTQQDLETYGPVQRGQTLWSIASELSANSGVSVNQVMLAIQRYNPEAFGQGNINMLRSGTILRLPPPSEAARMSARQAMLESMRQADDYADILAGRMPEFRPAPILADPGESAIEEPGYASVAAADDEGRLELIPPLEDPGLQEESGVAGQGESGPSMSDAEPDAVLLSEEEQEVAAQESEYLSQRIEELQEELDGSEAAVEVQDKGLAEMEQQLREQRSSEAADQDVSPGEQSRTAQDVDSRGAVSRLADSRMWLLLLPVILVVGIVFWWMQRRSGTGDAAAPEPVSPVDSPSETARVIADEAEEIVRALNPDAEEGIDSSTKPEEADETLVIDLEDYIGHVAREPNQNVEPDPPTEHEDDDRDRDEPATGESSSDQRPQGSSPGDAGSAKPEPQPGANDESVTVAESLGGCEDEPDEEQAEANDPETKLDLARAYISMGDAEAARELLTEVMREGNEAQVVEAVAMMDEI